LAVASALYLVSVFWASCSGDAPWLLSRKHVSGRAAQAATSDDNRIGKGSRPLFTRRRRCGISAVLTRHNRFENSTARIGPRKRRLDRKSFSVNCTMNPGRWPISGTYLTSAGCLAIWLGFASDFPGNPELRLVLSQGLRIQTWGIHSWCLIEMATRPLRVAL